MAERIFLLAKFGKKEHLESLQGGCLYLNSIKNYRDDGTHYRGDKTEGGVPIDPCSLKFFDCKGNALNVPIPSSAIEYLDKDDNMLMFCTSIIDKGILIEQSTNEYILSDTYKKEMEQFGEYVLIFQSSDLLFSLRQTQKIYKPEFSFESGRILYRDLNDFSKSGSYFTAYRITGRNTDRYFVKGLDYKNQNEWRIILESNQEPFALNKMGGYTIHIDPIPDSALIEAKDFFNRLRAKNKTVYIK